MFTWDASLGGAWVSGINLPITRGFGSLLERDVCEMRELKIQKNDASVEEKLADVDQEVLQEPFVNPLIICGNHAHKSVIQSSVRHALSRK